MDAFEEEKETLAAIFGDGEGPQLVEGVAAMSKKVTVESFRTGIEGIEEQTFVASPGDFQIQICLEIPETYPLLPPKIFSLTPLWLPKCVTESLSQAFTRVIESQPGEVVIFQLWQAFEDLEADKILQSTSDIQIPNLYFQEDGYVGLELKKYEVSFMDKIWTCGICFSEYPGREMHQLPVCEHFFCTGCMTEFVTTHITEASVRSMACPEPSCKEEIPAASVQRLVSKDLYDRYDRLMLVRALNGMKDLAYCPQKNCAIAIAIDKGVKNATCPGCHYHFCLHCFGAFHGLTTCPRFLSESEKEYLSVKYIMDVGKECPNCQTMIEKNGGCDHMYCTNCNTPFNWSAAKAGRTVNRDRALGAGSPAEGSSIPDRALRVGFSSRSTQPAPAGLVATVASKEKSQVELISKPCPRCHLRRQKHVAGSGDTIYCLNCQKGFCFHCGETLQGSHFVRGLCKYRVK